MPTVTSKNREEFNAAEMAKKDGASIGDPSMYRTFFKEAEELSKSAKDSMEHWQAMGAHKHASMFAKPHPVHKEHDEKAKFHAAESRKLKRVEMERYIKEREANAAAANRKRMVQSGIVAGSDYEKGNMPLYKGQG
jgi:hypothetical protein